MINFTLKTSRYNERRYGKPWIAKLNFDNSIKGDFQFKDWLGDPGCSGQFIVEDCKEGDCFAIGQKDHRKNYGCRIYVVLDKNGDLYKIDKITARKISKGQLNLSSIIEQSEKLEEF